LLSELPQRWRGLLPWLVLLVIGVCCFYFKGQVPWISKPPEFLILPVADWINTAMNWFVATFKSFFRAINWVLEWPLTWVQDLLQWLPWTATAVGFCLVAYLAAGWRLVLFTALSLFYMAVTGYWAPSMNTLAVVMISVPLALVIGFILAVAAYKKPGVNAVVQPMLDFMQTVPTFAYLIPILLLFGFGPVVGVVASAIYACPPMVRNMILGLQRASPDVLESGLMSGATPTQLFWRVRIPSAMSNIMIGVNQTTMAALSMVIIAAIIGGSADIGWEVLSKMRKAQFGQSLLAGIVIALIAMILDRVSWGFTDRRRALARRQLPWVERIVPWCVAGLLVGMIILLSKLWPSLSRWPEQWVVYPAAQINSGLTWMTTHLASVTDAVKESVLFFYLLPLKFGLVKIVSPRSWGFELQNWMIWSYALAAVVVALWCLFSRSWQTAAGIIVAAMFIFYGFTGVPWILFIMMTSLLAWQVGGLRLCLLSLSGWLFMVVTGLWNQTMLSVYLCLAAVIVCFIVGGALGIWASENQRVSNFLRPINDTLQTMPLFVILIPFLMFFQIGEFTSFLAIIAYAIVPCIRYTEHGLRNVPEHIVEAARAMGSTRRQILWEVKMPLAVPEIMLGLNQTVMFALAMLVITALAGSKGLGQSVYIALSNADAGMGVVAGLGMAFIAIIADRILQGASRSRKAALGLT